jgi:hypothetical protein
VWVIDGPQVKLLGAPEGDLEENKDEVTLQCIADANPPATIVWKKSGRPEIYGFQASSTTLPTTTFFLILELGIYSFERKSDCLIAFVAKSGKYL